MDKILILDTSVGSANRGDEIIMECVYKELSPLFENAFVQTLPTHVSSFHWYQVARNSLPVQRYASSKYKFVGGTNLLVPNLFTHYPQWNINLFNYQPIKDCILVGVGAGAGAEKGSNYYTRYIYRNLLNRHCYHSVRDDRSKKYVESLGLKAINTGCATMWMLTPDFCRQIPAIKANNVVFTLTAHNKKDLRDQFLIDTVLANYKNVFFWPQGMKDYDYFAQFHGINDITILPPTKESFNQYLSENATDYVGTRLHGGIYSMRHKRRSIIVAIDERARAINEKNHLNCVDINNISDLGSMINSELPTELSLDFEAVNFWKSQFGI